MPGTTKDRRRAKRKRLGQRPGSPLQVREFNYLLQISAAETRLLARYEQTLVQGVAQFAEAYYNYLFDNPAIADVLYSFERSGGNIGDLVRSQLQHLLGILKGASDEDWIESLNEIGFKHYQHGVRPEWMLGGYRLYLDHLQQILTSDPGIDEEHRELLKTALVKLVMRDFSIVTERYWQTGMQRLEQQRSQLAETQALSDDLLNAIPQKLWSVDIADNRILYITAGLQGWLDQEAKAPIPWMDKVLAADHEQVLDAWQRALDGETSEAEARLTGGDSEARWFRFQFIPVANRRGRVLRVHGVLEDITESRASREQLTRGLTQDSLTQLANRTLWYDHLSTALAASRRNPGTQVGVLVLDINQFKMYNDTLGHQVGDDLLCQVAQRLIRMVRDSDTVARMGSDEFGLVLTGLRQGEHGAERVARQVLSCFDNPFAYEDRELCLSAAVGVALYPDHGKEAHALVSHAHSAMYQAKRNGERLLIYEHGSDTSPKEQLQFSGQLRNALERQEFELHYQPQVALGSRRLCRAEALLRWQHPQEGLVLPKRFIPLAEQLGMTMPITNWVLVTALHQCGQWARQGLRLPIAINVSARSFQSPGLLERVASALKEAGVEGDCLEIEITEDTLMADLDRGAEVLRALRELGVAVAIDDFGTGYSSLAYLKNLPIHTLKIDRSFLSDMSHSDQDAAIVRSIIELGHNLGCTVVAEGVEDAASWDLLKVLGCDAVQGYHVSRPLTEHGFAHWLHETSWGSPPLD
jgi:diguanylate cyclase (GGDEF)-like protein